MRIVREDERARYLVILRKCLRCSLRSTWLKQPLAFSSLSDLVPSSFQISLTDLGRPYRSLSLLTCRLPMTSLPAPLLRGFTILAIGSTLVLSHIAFATAAPVPMQVASAVPVVK